MFAISQNKRNCELFFSGESEFYTDSTSSSHVEEFY